MRCTVSTRGAALQSVDLLNVKNRITLHKGNGAFGFLAGRGVGLGADDLVGIDHKAAMVALADTGFQFARLPV